MSEATLPEKNRLGLEKNDYRGAESTLCLGCGHNAIVSQIVTACFELSIPPESVIKLSGIGCSSKAPTYFLSRAHGVNGLHGRMPSMATGAVLANHAMRAIGMSGDGDSANIGIGQFKHLCRRNVPIVYIIANNGVYGLTKGQFSATADMGLELRKGNKNLLPPMDICQEAFIGGATFVARAFAGDPRQMLTLFKAALCHKGTAVVDVISPCVTFNNKDDSPKSYAYGRAHEERIHDLTFVPAREEIRVDYEPGTVLTVPLWDGATLVLKKVGAEYDPTNRVAAIQLMESANAAGQFITGLIFVDEHAPSFIDTCGMREVQPLASLAPEKTRPSERMLEEVNRKYA